MFRDDAWPAALRFVAACCTWPQDAGRIQAAWTADVEDADVLAVALRHRVTGIVSRGLHLAGLSLGPVPAQALAHDVAVNGQRSLMQTRATIQLQSLLDSHGIKSLALKGVAVAAQAYNDVGIKSARDVDILIAPNDVTEAVKVLEGSGYELIEPLPAGPQLRIRDHLYHFKDLQLLHRRTGVLVELHWRLFYNHRLLPAEALVGTEQRIDLAGASVRTLGEVEQYMYLCAHGAFHGWSRLKWSTDLCALLRKPSSASPATLHEAALGHGMGPASAAFLILAHRHLNLEVDGAFLRRLEGSGSARSIVRTAEMALAWGKGQREIDDYDAPWRRILLSRLRIRDDSSYILSELARVATPLNDLKATRLPRPLHPLLYVFRVPLWLWRRLGQRRALSG